MMWLSNSSMLWLLAGLSIPVAIHLLSRKEGSLIRIGSIRHLEETPTSKFRSLKLNEVPLLLLRALMIVLVVLLLSGLMFRKDEIGDSEKWLLVENGIDDNPMVAGSVDSLVSNGYELRFLADGFPKNKPESQKLTDYRKLIHDLENEQVEAIVFTKSRLNSFRGSIVSLPEQIRWISIPAEGSFETIQQIKRNDKAWIRRALFTDSVTLFISETSEANLTQSVNPDSIIIDIYATENFDDDKHLIIAAIRSIQKQTPHILTVREIDNMTVASPRSLLINLSESTSRDYRAINYQPGISNQLLKKVSRSEWQITKRLDQENVLDHNLAAQLMEILLRDTSLESEIHKKDIRVADKNLAFFSSNENDSQSTETSPLASADATLVFLILATLVIERMVAFRRNQ